MARLIITLQLDIDPRPNDGAVNQRELENYLTEAIEQWGGQDKEGSRFFYTEHVRSISIQQVLGKLPDARAALEPKEINKILADKANPKTRIKKQGYNVEVTYYEEKTPDRKLHNGFFVIAQTPYQACQIALKMLQGISNNATQIQATADEA